MTIFMQILVRPSSTEQTEMQKEIHMLNAQHENEPFIGFYNKHGIIPVTQDTRRPDFIFKRNSLYKLLGLPLPSLRDRTILEFGPGGGYNALALTRYTPKSYVFVDASIASLDELKRKQEANLFGNVAIEIIAENIINFEDDRKFDVVIAEGVLPGQKNPNSMLKHISRFVSDEGYLIITTTTATSMLSEACRRIFLPNITSTYKLFEDQLLAGTQIFQTHLNTLKTATRPIEDWVLDTIFNPWESSSGMCFTLLDSINTLGNEFDFYGSSPQFLIDDRFYKKIGPDDLSSSTLAKQQFPAIYLALIDYRVKILKALEHRTSLELEPACKAAYDLHTIICADSSYDKLDQFLACLREINGMIPCQFEATINSIQEFIELFPRFLENQEVRADFQSFSSWWGRGQQYVSFIRSGLNRLK
jgi:2-polyprenyl-3-methyl-5-hydroxy-6-metoxy-1,4-benzoquinol methylase